MMANCVAIARNPSVDFCGDWPRHISALLRVFNFEQTEVCKQSQDGWKPARRRVSWAVSILWRDLSVPRLSTP
jgi:hypothetical protein